MSTIFYNRTALPLLFFIGLIIGTGQRSAGQQVVFSQQFASPLQLNPAFAGSKPFTRMDFGYRTHSFPHLNAFQSMHFSIDGYNAGVMGGVGILFTRDIQANILNSNQLTGAYSLHLQLTSNLFMNLGLGAGLINKGIQWNNLVFSDQINMLTGEVLQMNEQNLDGGIWVPNFSAGMLLFNSRIFGGFAMHHLNRPNLSLMGNQLRIPIHYIAKIGGYFSLENIFPAGIAQENFFVSPNIILSIHGVKEMLTYGMHFGLSQVFAGIWMRQDFALPETLILMLGLKTGNFRFSYSFDHSLSGFSGVHHGAHEIAIRFSLINNNKKARINIINSPDF